MSKIVQLGGVLPDIPIFGNSFWSAAKKGKCIAWNLQKIFLDKQTDRFNKECIKSSVINLTNNEIKDIVKVIESLKTIAISLKRTTRKNTSQEGGFLNFLRPLMRAGLPLMKSLITPLAKIFLSAAVAAFQQNIYGSWSATPKISNKEMKGIMKIIEPYEELWLLKKGISEIIENGAK